MRKGSTKRKASWGGRHCAENQAKKTKRRESEEEARPCHLHPKPNIPKELMFEILARLSIMCLLRFRSVSKYWFNLISSPDFIKFRLQKACNDSNYSHHKLLYIDKYNYGPTLRQAPLHCALYHPISDLNDRTDIPNPMKFGPEESPRFVGSCNGLVCITSLKDKVFLWNPTLRKCKRLPNFGRGWLHYRHGNSSIFYGFGYDESSDDYKVVGVCNIHYSGSPHPKMLVKIYSLRSNSWKKLQDEEFGLDGGVNSHGCFVNGKLHWATRKKIYSIDLSNELFGVVAPPDCVKECCDWDINVAGEFLTVFPYYRRSHVDLWMVKQYGVKESWTKVNTRYPIDCFLDTQYVLLFVNKEGEIFLRRMYVPASEEGEPTFLLHPGNDGGQPRWMHRACVSSYALLSVKHGFYVYNGLLHENCLYPLHSPLGTVIVYVESLVWPISTAK